MSGRTITHAMKQKNMQSQKKNLKYECYLKCSYCFSFPAEEAGDKAWGSVAKIAPIVLVSTTEPLVPRYRGQDAEVLTLKYSVILDGFGELPSIQGI